MAVGANRVTFGDLFHGLLHGPARTVSDRQRKPFLTAYMVHIHGTCRKGFSAIDTGASLCSLHQIFPLVPGPLLADPHGRGFSDLPSMLSKAIFAEFRTTSTPTSVKMTDVSRQATRPTFEQLSIRVRGDVVPLIFNPRCAFALLTARIQVSPCFLSRKSRLRKIFVTFRADFGLRQIHEEPYRLWRSVVILHQKKCQTCHDGPSPSGQNKSSCCLTGRRIGRAQPFQSARAACPGPAPCQCP